MRTIRANGERIAMLRDMLDITQEELSAKVGYSVKTLWKAETGGRLRRRTLEDIATALGVSLAEVAMPCHDPLHGELRRSRLRVFAESE